MPATVTYQSPASVAGGTVAPAAGIVASMVTGTVNWLDADLTAIVTHNFALSTSELAQLFPLSSREIDPSNAGTIVPVVSVTKTTNNVTYTKVSAAGSGGTFQFFLQRPNTIVR